MDEGGPAISGRQVQDSGSALRCLSRELGKQSSEQGDLETRAKRGEEWFGGSSYGNRLGFLEGQKADRGGGDF